ncbi:hypothetical protein [Halogeometricum luteum]|uniref:Uncharacterized protein n=1 Tax=Halogeometricum luteum TaxID=2950537 RepID=A0ABU2G6Q5_9EURY|nr:hypothetical protein [Halogeometricum sp. S3BR5-2]MDS0296477.1 hypothetical protein [Halogeometricum sp. S3BR5-2]
MGEDRQATFGSDGSLDTETPPEAREGTTDWGEPKGDGETDGGYNRYDVSSLLQKAVRRSDEEVAAWAAWELARSGYAWNLWDRLHLYVVEDLRAGQDVALLVERYETLATERWDPQSWKGRLCAIHAALACARARSSREASNADEFFRNAAAARAEARGTDEDPAVDFPVSDLEPDGPYDVIFDKHTAEGSRRDRGEGFFKRFGARVGPEGEDEQSARWQRLNMALSDVEYDEAELDHAVEPVDPERRWEDPVAFGDEEADADADADGSRGEGGDTDGS